MTRPPRFRVAAPLLLFAAAAVVRTWALGSPDTIVFDETYYVEDALAHLAHGAEEGFAVHPPLGKWLIALGIAVLGDGPVGWRVAAALAGAVVVLLTYLVARRLLPEGIGPAFLAGLLVAVDGLMIVQSRIAMLDVFLAMFVTAAAWLILVDRDANAGGPLPGPVRPQLMLAGAMLGLAVATKWSGLLALGAASLYVIGAEIVRRRRTEHPPLARPARLIVGLGLGLVVVPVVVYALSWTGWLVGYPQTHEGRADCVVDGEVLDPCPATIGDRVEGLVRHHRGMWRFHTGLQAEHPYISRAWTWPLMTRPIVYHWESCPPSRAHPDPADDDPPEPCVVEAGNAEQIIALGNPAVWWTALLALIPLGIGAARRDPRAVFVLVFWGAQYVPWLIVGRPLFFFYMTPVVPFMALGLAYAVTWLRENPIGTHRARRIPTVVGALVAVAAIAAAAHFLPVWLGIEMPVDAIRRRWWFDGWI